MRGVAQFGSALVWGTRGRRFKSCHSDIVKNRLNPMGSGGFCLSFIRNCNPHCKFFSNPQAALFIAINRLSGHPILSLLFVEKALHFLFIQKLVRTE